MSTSRISSRRAPRQCSVEGCERPHHQRGLCITHYFRQRKHGSEHWQPRLRLNRLCSVDGCGQPREAHGLCRLHRDRQRKHGDPLAFNATVPGEPQRFLVEVVLPYEGDECIPWPYGRAGNGYARLKVDGRPQYVHAIVCEHRHGPRPPGHVAAHTCLNGHEGCVNQLHVEWETPAQNRRDEWQRRRKLIKRAA